MRPKESSQGHSQGELYRSGLEQILSHRHPLYLLAKQMDWSVFEQEFGLLYVEKVGRPGLPIRLLVGLHYLKYTFNESDESVVERFIENPYWQYFCGLEYFQHEFPLDPTSLVKWRKRVGPGGMEAMLKVSIETAKGQKLLKGHHMKRMNVDTTVQEKAIAFPTDARLYHKMRMALVRVSGERGIALRQTYKRLSKLALQKQGRYGHARQMKRARRETKRLKVFLGCVTRDIERKIKDPDERLEKLLRLSNRLMKQERKDKNKLYSIHAPEVECISKGKAHKRYEFGCKVSMVTTSKGNWIVGIDALHGNPYDGHTFKQAMEQTERITGQKPEHVYSDKGYRGAEEVPGTTLHLTNKRKKRLTRSQWRWLRRRSAIEPVFGHLKSDNRLERNHLQGEEGDRINAILSGCGFNLRKLMTAFCVYILNRLIVAYRSRKNDKPPLILNQGLA